ncbi:cysteine hydrolase family protein [Dongia rigui]|uniref:Cysteine hydrolase family protein n=1 Tax=Dongia rigui TaxID=940149 RepID=A0ABU5DXU6_9PROT|nr:cysteine hydrolase family protein [Dongia rigui]MDY0871396.1 cysteine hydrolase family protein [Dongia rigui]
MTTALLIIDVQKAILAGAGAPDRQPVLDRALDVVVGRLHDLQEKARKAGVPVVVVQHNDQGDHRLAKGLPGWELRPEIAPLPGEALVHKTACDSFYETSLQDELQKRGITHLVVGGCMTQYCVDTTTRRAVTMGYDVTLISDGHMTGDRGALTYDQIIAHHNMLLDGFDAGPKAVSVKKAAEIAF